MINNDNGIYKGYKEISGNTGFINDYMSNIDVSEWHTNEYLLINNEDEGDIKELRWDGTKFVPLKLPPSKYVKAKNPLQRCALDLLNNPEITVCALLGVPGSGKSYLCTKMANYCVKEKGWQSKMVFIREPWGEGRSEGYLKGTFEEKNAVWELPIIQQFDGQEFEVDRLRQQGVIEFNIPTYMKGCSYSDSVLVVDESEDLTAKQIRLIGTRVANNSRILFDGDVKQSLLDCSDSNPLLRMCHLLKGNKLFGCILLNVDVRSETSQLFAEMEI